MKRFLIGVMIVVAMFVVAPTPARAVTIAELQAMIAQLTAQLNALLSQQNSTPSTDIINPTATSTGLIVFSERPTLKLAYDSNRGESRLEGSGAVTVQAGVKDVLLANVNLKITDMNGRYSPMMTSTFDAISGATQEGVQTSDNFQYKVWRINANSKASFKLSLTANPQIMFAGSYVVSLAEPSTVNAETGYYKSGTLAYEDTKSLPVTIVGEKSPYIQSADASDQKVQISGVRFSRESRVYVEGVYKGKLQNVGITNVANGTYQGSFPVSWLKGPTSAGDPCYRGTVQIEDLRYGKSNNFWVSKQCLDTASTVKYDTPVTSPSTGDSWSLNDNQIINWTYPTELAGKLVNLTIKLQTPDGSNGWVFDSESITVANPSLGQGLQAGIPWSSLVQQFPGGVPAGQYNILVTADDTTTNISHRGLSGQFNITPSTTPITPTEIGPAECNSNSTYTFSTNLTVGSTGAEVLRLKCFLMSKGFLSSSYMTNYFGPMTKAALAAYQASKGLTPADGYFGPMTRAAVNADINSIPIANPTITVTSPNGGETWQSGSTHNITWNVQSTYNFNTNIYLASALDMSREWMVATNVSSIANTGNTFTWTVGSETPFVNTAGSPPPGNYYISVCRAAVTNVTNGGEDCDYSNNYFTITSPSTSIPVSANIIISKPTAGTYKIGDIMTFLWSLRSGVTGARAYTFGLVDLNGTEIVLERYAAVAGYSYTARIPQLTPGTYRAFVRDDVTPSVTAYGESFTVTSVASTPTVVPTVSANYTLSLSKLGSGSGSVFGNSGTIRSYPASIKSGSSVTLTATPSAGSVFSGWGGVCTGTGNCGIIMDSNKNVEAEFDKIGVSRAEQINSIANVLQAIKEMLAKTF